jgi:hypothetical protein
MLMAHQQLLLTSGSYSCLQLDMWLNDLLDDGWDCNWSEHNTCVGIRAAKLPGCITWSRCRLGWCAPGELA